MMPPIVSGSHRSQETPVGATPAWLDRVFPFHFELVGDAISRVGPSLARMAPDLLGAELDAVLQPRDPFTGPGVDLDRLCHLTHASGLMLRGQFTAYGDRVVFLGSPWLSSTERAARGLGADAFAAHDATLELLDLLEQRENVIAKGRTLSSELKRQSSLARLANAELNRINTELRNSERELARARDAAEQAAQAKAEFLANMSHEIRTPLNSVIGTSILLLDTVVTDEQRDFVETIRGSGQILLALINDILDLSKIDAGKLDLETSSFELATAVDATLDVVGAVAHGKRLHLSAWIAADVPSQIRADVVRIQQILVNLLGNALKFTAHGEVDLRITRSGARADGQCVLRFDVRDTGIGIAPERIDRLFQNFSQVHSAANRSFGGTGLGLAISRRLVEAMDGTMAVASALGEGSTFSFTIPVIAEVADSGATSARPRLQVAALTVIDPAPRRRANTVATLASWGIAAAAYPNLAAAQAAPFGPVVVALGLDDDELLVLLADRRVRRLVLGAERAVSRHGDVDDARSAAVDRGLRIASIAMPMRWSRLHRALSGVLEMAPSSPAMPPVQAPVALEVASLRVLLAEDNVVNQRVATLLLKRLGVRADVVSDGYEVLAALERQRYDAVFLDVQMPRLDGIGTARRIVADHGSGRPWMCALTANATRADREACLSAGMDHFLTKPLQPEELRRAIELAATQTARAASAAGPGPVQADSHEREVRTAALERQLAVLATEAGPDFVPEIVELFMTEAAATLTRLTSAITSGDAKAIERQSHALRGAALNVGADALVAVTAQLEQRGRRGDLDGIATSAAVLEDEARAVFASLRAILAVAGVVAKRATPGGGATPSG